MESTLTTTPRSAILHGAGKRKLGSDAPLHMTMNYTLDVSERERARMLSDVVELCEDYWNSLSSKPVWSKTDEAALHRVLKLGIPESPASWEATLGLLRDSIFIHQAHLVHPRFFAFIPSPSNFVSCLADFLAAVHNPFVAS